MEKEKMWYVTNKSFVTLYGFTSDGNAVIYDPQTAGRMNGRGLMVVKLSKLIPPEYVSEEVGGFVSKTKRNEIKSKLKIVTAEWKCTDGTVYDHEHLEDAIAHQSEIEESAVSDG